MTHFFFRSLLLGVCFCRMKLGRKWFFGLLWWLRKLSAAWEVSSMDNVQLLPLEGDPNWLCPLFQISTDHFLSRSAIGTDWLIVASLHICYLLLCAPNPDFWGRWSIKLSKCYIPATILIYLASVLFCAGELLVCAIGPRYCLAHLMFDLSEGKALMKPYLLWYMVRIMEMYSVIVPTQWLTWPKGFSTPFLGMDWFLDSTRNRTGALWGRNKDVS